MNPEHGEDTIASTPAPECYLCSTEGEPLYDGLRDRFFGAPGIWNLKRCRAPQCGLVWLDPMPTEDDIAKAYRNYLTHGCLPVSRDTWLRRIDRSIARAYIAHKYGYNREQIAAWQKTLAFLPYLYPGRKEEFDKEVMYLPARLRGRLLDVGCGSGEVLADMESVGWEAVGVDVDSVAVEVAQGKGLSATCGTLEEQQYPDNGFQAITMNHVIEHVHDPVGLLRECRRILAPGGHLIVITPNLDSWGHRRFDGDWFHLDPPRHLWLFSRRTLRSLVERSGFLRVRVSTTVHHAHRQFIASSFIKRSGHILHKPTTLRKLWGEGMELVEWALLNVRPDSGEEILLQARK